MIGVGIDPGLTGAVAFVDSRGSAVIKDIPTIELPGNGMVRRRVDGRALAQLMRQQIPAVEGVRVWIEDVHAIGGSSMQTMGSMMRSLGAIEAVLEVLRLSPEPVNPKAWKRFYGLGSDKGASLTTARTLYPSLACNALKLAKHHNRAEALLIAHRGLKELA